jgi:chemotaxis protein MotB
MAEKKPMIVIKKITVVQGGAHGGAWKVAFADFMTAMMAFFLVMWLLNTQSDAGKKAIADHFSTPSVIEYQFQNFGAQLTLEKLFLDLINEPLRTLATFLSPMDRSPNIMGMGMKKVVASFMADKLGSVATNVDIQADQVTFEIPDTVLFKPASTEPAPQFSETMTQIKAVSEGLEESVFTMTSVVYINGQVSRDQARTVAQARAEILRAKVEGYLENPTVEIRAQFQALNDNRTAMDDRRPTGYLRFEVRQKEITSDGRKPRQLADDIFGSKDDPSKTVYQNFVDRVSQDPNRRQGSEQGDRQ